MPPTDPPVPAPEPHPRVDPDAALLADLTAPPSVEDSREAYLYWDHRRAELPIRKRAERKEAEHMAAQWKERLQAAERERHGPGPVEQLLDILGVRWRPDPRRVIAGLSLVAVILVVVVLALIAAIIVFWPELQPVIRTLLNNGGDGGGG